MNQYINTILASIRISDIIDILIVTFILYKAWGFVRTSRAAQLAKGLVILLIIYLVSGVANFYVIHWMLDKILSVGIIALVVVFQPELRRILEVIGRGKFTLRSFSISTEGINAQVSMIVRAVDYFAMKREGAIIVLEQETALQDVSETGTILDCEISEEILENIFYKGSPLHDGAVILRGNRVLAAGCVLPLTGNQNLSKDLGTRHRAAIGITEVSDSAAIVVSEETGIISLAVDGKLSRFMDLKSIEKYLTNMYVEHIEENQNVVQRVGNFLKRGKNGTEE